MGDHRLLRGLAVLGIGAAVAGGFALARSGDDAAALRPRPDRPATTVAVDTAVIDWAAPGTVDLGAGWTVTDTEGDAPMLTVLRHGRPVGIVEYLDFPLETPADDVVATLDAHVARYVEDIGRDRAGAPIEGYRFVPDAAVHLRGADGAMVRYGFRATLPDGRPSERTIQWAGIRGGRLVLVGASAYDAGGLFSREGTEFTSADLDAVAERLHRLVRASGLPDPALHPAASAGPAQAAGSAGSAG